MTARNPSVQPSVDIANLFRCQEGVYVLGYLNFAVGATGIRRLRGADSLESLVHLIELVLGDHDHAIPIPDNHVAGRNLNAADRDR